jgi:hypothetical protein
MDGPFIFIATNRLKPGKLEDERKRERLKRSTRAKPVATGPLRRSLTCAIQYFLGPTPLVERTPRGDKEQ